MPNVLQLEDLEYDIYSCVPGEKNTPHYMLMDDEFEVLAFPALILLVLVAIQQVVHIRQNCLCGGISNNDC